MIGHLYGQLVDKQAPILILDVHGVGYEIHAPMSTFYQLPETGASVKLLTHLIIREDAHVLYGFYSAAERQLFKTLLKVNGVGPRLALTILSNISTEEFVKLVLSNDTAQLIHLPGVGKKTAERLVIEMRDKLDDWHSLSLAFPPSIQSGVSETRHPILQDAIAALVALGYKSQEANRVVAKVDTGEVSREELIRLALREIKS